MLDPVCGCRCARLNEERCSDRTQSCKGRRYPDYGMVAAYEGVGDRMLNEGVGIVSGGEQRAGGVDLSTGVGGQRELSKRSIQRAVEDCDQHRAEDSDRKQRSQAGDCVVDAGGDS